MPSTGTPESKISCGARGEPSSCTDSGPPERITAFGFIGINALLPHPARDQLRHLAAEIDDQNLVMRRGHRGHRLAGWLSCCHGKQLRDGGRARNRTKPMAHILLKASTKFL